jgi:hypothetical protein
MASEQSKLFTWLLENLRPANNQEFVDLIEIKSKCTTEIRLLNCMFSLLLSHHEIP